MNCEEFKKTILEGKDIKDESKTHLENCNKCKDWLNKELQQPPEGISKEKWDILLKPQAPKNEEEQQPVESNKTEENKSFLDYYLSGLKYGIVFGLAIVIGFAIIQNKNEDNELPKNNNNTVASDTIIINPTTGVSSETSNIK